MAYILLATACLLFSLQFLFSKGFQLKSRSGPAASLWMTVLDGAWFLLLFWPLNGFALHMTPTAALYSALFAVFGVICNMATYFALGRGKVAVVTLFTLTGGLVLPVLYGTIGLGETLRPGQWVGIGLILLSFFPGVLFPGRPPAEKAAGKGGKGTFLILCAVIFVTNGLVSVVAKAHAVAPDAVPERDFLLFAAMLRLGVGLLLLAGARLKSGPGICPPIRGYGRAVCLSMLLAGGFTLCNGTGNLFSLAAAKTLSASLQFPLLSGAVVGLSALFSRGVYREKLSGGDLIGLGMTAAGVAAMIWL